MYALLMPAIYVRGISGAEVIFSQTVTAFLRQAGLNVHYQCPSVWLDQHLITRSHLVNLIAILGLYSYVSTLSCSQNVWEYYYLTLLKRANA